MTFSKGSARKLRAIGKIPAIIYGHGTDPKHVTLPDNETAFLLRKSNIVVALNVAGDTQLALIKGVQKDPVRALIEHIDLIIVRKGELVTVDVPVRVEDTFSPSVVATLDSRTLTIEVEATTIPDYLTVSAQGLPVGSQIFARDIRLPPGCTLVSDADTLVVSLLPSGIAEPADLQTRLDLLASVLGHDRLQHILRLTGGEMGDPSELAELPAHKAELVAGLERVVAMASERWGGAAIDWLRGPNVILEGARPVDVLELSGFTEVARAIRLSAA